MSYKFNFLLAMLCLILFSCKKDKLSGDASILVGKWEWRFTEEIKNVCNPPEYTDTIWSSQTAENYALEFYEKGIVKYYKNKEQIEKYRIELDFDDNNVSGSNYPYKYAAYLDGDFNHPLQGFVNTDTMFVYGEFPFQYSCDKAINYFVKK